MPQTLIRARRALLGVLALVCVPLVASCDDPYAPISDSDPFDVAFVVWALNGTPVAYPTVHLMVYNYTVRPDAAATFDFGFDIDSTGQVLVLPAGRIVPTAKTVAFQLATGPYSSVEFAPKGGWMPDTILRVGVGETFLVRADNSAYCATYYYNNPVVYAKYRVDSIIPAERRMVLRGRVNGNCGFRSFADGISKF